MKIDQLQDITLIHGDCMDFMATLPDKAFKLAIVDPDYGLDDKIANGGTWAAKYKNVSGQLGGKPTKEYFDQLFRISENQIIWGGNYFIDMLYPTRCFIIWDKVAKMDTLADCEMAWTSFDRNAKIYCHARNGSDQRIHICQKPTKLYKWLLKNYANEGDNILDTHLGSGSSAIAAHDGHFKFTGIELDADYFEAAKKRVMYHQRQTNLF